jgi:hypothetical protein
VAAVRANEHTLDNELVRAGPKAAAKKTAPAAWNCSTKLKARRTTDRISAISGVSVAWRPIP